MAKDENTIPEPSLANPSMYWKLLSARPVSVPIVAAEDDRGPAGFLGLSVSHVSADPPAMSVAIGKSTSALDTIVRSRCFAISYLPGDASEMAEIFGGRRKVDGAARFRDGEWQRLKTGAPAFVRSILALDCTLDRISEYNDTVIAIGIICDYKIAEKNSTLINYYGKYISYP